MRSLLFALFCFLTSVFALAAVDLNSATEPELETLPGVGSSIARNIINARPFHSVAELKNVKGIGNAKFRRLEPMVTASAPAERAPTPTAIAPAATPPAAEPAPREALTKLAPGERININTASLEALERLPGIGPKKALAIIQARSFHSPEEITRVRGIKERTFARIKDEITVQ